MNASIGVWLLKAVSCHDLISEMCCGLLLIPVYSVNVLCQRTKYWWITSSERRPSHPPICILVSVLFYNVGWIWITLFPPPKKKKKSCCFLSQKNKRDTLRFTVGTVHFRGFSVEPVEKAVKTNTSVAYWKLYVKHTTDLIFSICIVCALIWAQLRLCSPQDNSGRTLSTRTEW